MAHFDLPGVEPDSDLEAVFRAVGFVVVQWSLTEQSLDLLVANIFHFYQVYLPGTERPRQLSAKLKFLKKCFTEFPDLVEFNEELEKLSLRFEALGKKRNDLVHGGIASVEVNNGQHLFVKLDVSTAGHKIRSVSLNEADWMTFRKDLLDLGKDGIKFSKRVFNKIKTT